LYPCLLSLIAVSEASSHYTDHEARESSQLQLGFTGDIGSAQRSSASSTAAAAATATATPAATATAVAATARTESCSTAAARSGDALEPLAAVTVSPTCEVARPGTPMPTDSSAWSNSSSSSDAGGNAHYLSVYCGAACAAAEAPGAIDTHSGIGSTTTALQHSILAQLTDSSSSSSSSSSSNTSSRQQQQQQHQQLLRTDAAPQGRPVAAAAVLRVVAPAAVQDISTMPPRPGTPMPFGCADDNTEELYVPTAAERAAAGSSAVDGVRGDLPLPTTCNLEQLARLINSVRYIENKAHRKEVRTALHHTIRRCSAIVHCNLNLAARSSARALQPQRCAQVCVYHVS
jgi:hypothetical protein